MSSRLADQTDDWNAKRLEVMVQAAELFADRGADSVSMRDIATAAKLHVSTLYYYFPSKAALYRAATAWAFERISSSVMNALNTMGSAREQCKLMTEAVVTFLMDDRVAARLLDYDFVFGASLWETSEYPQLTKDPTNFLADILTGMRSPLLQHMSALRAAEISWDVIYGIVRFSQGHARLTKEGSANFSKEELAQQSWVVVERLLFLGSDDK